MQAYFIPVQSQQVCYLLNILINFFAYKKALHTVKIIDIKSHVSLIPNIYLYTNLYTSGLSLFTETNFSKF